MNSADRKPDRRAIRTKRAIRNAFAKLLTEKELDKITMKDIADEANINRKTLYNYYSGLYRLIDEIEDELIASCERTMHDIDFRRDMRDPMRIFEKLNAVINQDLDFYGCLLSMHGNMSLAYKINAMLKSKVKEALLSQVELDDLAAEVLVDYSVTGMISVYQSWFSSGHGSIDEVAKLVSQICFNGANALLGTA